MAEQLGAKHAPVLQIHFILKIPSFHQDRIGTYIGKFEGKEAFSAGDIEATLRGKQEEWLSKRRYPICLSDASVYSENDLVSQLRGGRVRCVVWFGRGDGWDSRRTPGLQQIAETISSVQAEASRPQIAVVCLRYGSRQAAQRLLDAGVTTVLWLTADGLSDACAELYCDVVAPTLSLLEKADETEEHATAVLGQSLQKLWTGHQDSMPEPAGDNYGCIISAAPVAPPPGGVPHAGHLWYSLI